MRHTTKTATHDFSYLAVLLLLAYVLSSAPRYVRQLKEGNDDIKIEKMSPLKEVLKLGKYYGIDPYLRAWNRLTPGETTPADARPATNLASVK